MKTHLVCAAIAATTLFSAGAASANQAWVQNGISLNARSGPGTQYHVVGKFTPCTPVHVVGWSHGWARVAWNHGQYWVAGKYLQNRSCGDIKPRTGGYGY